ASSTRPTRSGCSSRCTRVTARHSTSTCGGSIGAATSRRSTFQGYVATSWVTPADAPQSAAMSSEAPPLNSSRHPHRWGFADTRLELEGTRSVRMTGSRYPLSGQSMPHLIPYVEQMLGVPFDPSARLSERVPAVPEPSLEPGLMAA